jgi:hypothetical protein
MVKIHEENGRRFIVFHGRRQYVDDSANDKDVQKFYRQLQKAAAQKRKKGKKRTKKATKKKAVRRRPYQTQKQVVNNYISPPHAKSHVDRDYADLLKKNLDNYEFNHIITERGAKAPEPPMSPAPLQIEEPRQDPSPHVTPILDAPPLLDLDDFSQGLSPIARPTAFKPVKLPHGQSLLDQIKHHSGAQERTD